MGRECKELVLLLLLFFSTCTYIICSSSEYFSVTVDSSTTALSSNCYSGSVVCGIRDAIAACSASSSLSSGYVCYISLDLSESSIVLDAELVFADEVFQWHVSSALGSNEQKSIERDSSSASYYRVVKNQGDLTFSNVKIANGYLKDMSEYGGGIENYGTVTLQSSVLFNNYVSKSNKDIPAYGGGVYNHVGSALILNDTTFFKNVANGGCTIGCANGETSKGGAIFNEGLITGQNVSFDTNRCTNHDDDAYGGAIYSEGTIDLVDMLFVDNYVSDDYGPNYDRGGAIYQESGTSTFTNVAFVDNLASTSSSSGTGAGGAIFLNGGTMTINRGTFSGNVARSASSGNAYIDGGSMNFVDTFGDGVVEVTGSYTLTTSAPTAAPTHSPPTYEPTRRPSSEPSSQPSTPTQSPSSVPSSQPSVPTSVPSFAPSPLPSSVPTVQPTVDIKAIVEASFLHVMYAFAGLLVVVVSCLYYFSRRSTNVRVADAEEIEKRRQQQEVFRFEVQLGSSAGVHEPLTWVRVPVPVQELALNKIAPSPEIDEGL